MSRDVPDLATMTTRARAIALAYFELGRIEGIAAHESWAHTPDRSARTAPARAALMAKFERQIDPDGTLSPDERARRQARELTAATEAADAELTSLGGGAA